MHIGAWTSQIACVTSKMVRAVLTLSKNRQTLDITPCKAFHVIYLAFNNLRIPCSTLNRLEAECLKKKK